MDHQQMDEGEYDMDFDGTGLASGVYFYRLSAEGIIDIDAQDEGVVQGQTFTQVKKMILMK